MPDDPRIARIVAAFEESSRAFTDEEGASIILSALDAMPPEVPIAARRCDGCVHWERKTWTGDDTKYGVCLGVPPHVENGDGQIFPVTHESARCPNWIARAGEE